MAIFFQPNCTLPSTHVSYVLSPNIRSTLDILWGCLATIIACTYTVLHLNVPEQRRDRDPGFRGDFKWGARRLYRSVKWAVITILGPEFILAKSWADYVSARRQLKKLHNKFPSTKQTWSMTHMLFADMGGFVLQYEKLESTETELQDVAPRLCVTRASGDSETAPLQGATAPNPTVAEIQSSDNKSMTFARPGSAIGTQGPDAVDKAEKADSDATPSLLWHLDAYILGAAIDEGLLSTDIVTAEEIDDKSKSDFFTKAIIIIQITYFVVGVLVRAGQDFAVTQLELGVVGFVACSFVTYCFCMAKPKGVCTAYTIKDFKDRPLPLRIKELQDSLARGSIFSDLAQSEHDGGPYANDNFPVSGGLDSILGFGGSVTSVLFGAIHLVGWNFEFPTPVDSWLWRIAALVSAGLAPLILAVVWAADVFEEVTGWDPFPQDFLDKFGVAMNCGIFGAYGLARLVLVVEMFRCLFYPPLDAFTSTWTVNIPHIG